MKLGKIKLTELADAKLNEREMCRILGGGTPGCCQCGCHYATSGGSSTSANDSANNSGGMTPDPVTTPPTTPITIAPSILGRWCNPTIPQDKLCGQNSDPMC